MQFLVIIILFSFSFSGIYPIHEKVQFSLDYELDPPLKESSLYDGYTHSSSINMKAMLYSGILPGAGEYLMGYKNRAYFFLGLEALAVGTWYTYNQRGIDTQDEYRVYADEYWSLDRWFYDYYKWSNSENSFHYNFINELSGEYSDIWEDSHHLNFSIDGNYYSSNSSEFRELYVAYNLSDSTMTVNFFNENNIQVEKDHHYYENIGKYDHFYAGWSDNDSLYVVVKELGGEYIAMSPHKKNYREIWNNSNDYYRISSFALSSIMANHFASMIDVLILSQLGNSKIKNLSAKTYFSPLNPYGVGGVKLLFNWN